MQHLQQKVNEITLILHHLEIAFDIGPLKATKLFENAIVERDLRLIIGQLVFIEGAQILQNGEKLISLTLASEQRSLSEKFRHYAARRPNVDRS